MASIPRLNPSTLEASVQGSNPKPSSVAANARPCTSPKPPAMKTSRPRKIGDQGVDGRDQDREGDDRLDEADGQSRPSERHDHERDRVPNGERAHDLDDPPQDRLPPGVRPRPLAATSRAGRSAPAGTGGRRVPLGDVAHSAERIAANPRSQLPPERSMAIAALVSRIAPQGAAAPRRTRIAAVAGERHHRRYG